MSDWWWFDFLGRAMLRDYLQHNHKSTVYAMQGFPGSSAGKESAYVNTSVSNWWWFDFLGRGMLRNYLEHNCESNVYRASKILQFMHFSEGDGSELRHSSLTWGF